MSNAITVTLLMKIKPEFKEDFMGGLPVLTHETSSSPGALSVRVLHQHEDPNAIFFVEEWESESDFDAYMRWRVERGDMLSLAQVLSEPPNISIWSSLS